MTCDNPLHLIPLLVLVGGILFFAVLTWSCGWRSWSRYPEGCVPSVKPLGDPPPIPPMRKLAGENPDPPPPEFRPDPPPDPPLIPD